MTATKATWSGPSRGMLARKLDIHVGDWKPKRTTIFDAPTTDCGTVGKLLGSCGAMDNFAKF